jgi:hypothetical protein
MKKLLIICLIITGCATTFTPVCRHNSLATAILYAEDGSDVRIIAYEFNDELDRHAEPQVKVNGQWKYINMNCNKNELSDNPEYKTANNFRYYNLYDYLIRIGVKNTWSW